MVNVKRACSSSERGIIDRFVLARPGKERLAGLDDASEGFKLFPELEVLSDGNATLTEEEHAGALNTFMMFFAT